jgi:hypothetical protein
VFYLDTEALALSAVDQDSGELTALDLVQHGLAGGAQGGRGLVEGKPASGYLRPDLVAQGPIEADSPRRCRGELLAGDVSVAQPS